VVRGAFADLCVADVAASVDDPGTEVDCGEVAILPGLVRYDEVAAGAIQHALRFTASQTRRAYIYPARHFASSSTSTSPLSPASPVTSAAPPTCSMPNTSAPTNCTC
jgi:hypothetical protein